MNAPDQDIATEILEWSKDRPGWQRDALRRLFTAGVVAPQELDELVQLSKAARGLTERLVPRVLAREHLATKGTETEAVSLVSLTHHRGANALASEQTVTFGPRLTAVYGQNAAGKSGYTRILKLACRSRFHEPILGDVLSGTAPAKLKATVRYRKGIQGAPMEWTVDLPPADALAAVSVFDAACAPVYLRDKTDVAFRPFGLDIFDRLASLCGEVRSRLESEKAKLAALAPTLPTFPEGTRSRDLIDHLTSLTSADEVRGLAELSPKEQVRLEELRAHRRDLLAANPKQRAKELTSRADRTDLLARHVGGLFAIFRGTALDRARSTAETLRLARETLASLRETALTSDLLPGTGEEAWRELWDAAEGFSAGAYPGSPFPVLASGARCPFCQQVIGKDADARLRHFAEYVSSTAQVQVREAEKTHLTVLSGVTQAVVVRPEIDLAIIELGAENATLAQAVRLFLESVERIQQGIGDALARSDGFLTRGVAQGPEAELQAAASGLRERARQLQAARPVMTPGDTAELNELDARDTLGRHLRAILDEIERKKRLAAYDQCIHDAATQAITRKGTELTRRLVTDQLRAGFQEELASLDFTHLAVEIKAAGGARGALFHRLVFTNAPGVPVTHVLSEGESRALSLASFLTELKTAAGRSAIIFDDPVSSLDHIWRERIARRLVAEAANRQVIVFTHDIVFLRFLLDEASRSGIACEHRHIWRDIDVGLSSDDLPWIAMNTKQRIARLRDRWQSAEKLFRASHVDYELDARYIYQHLRQAWERAVPEVLLNDVVQPLRHRIETQKVRYLHDISAEDCRAVENGMTECSRWLHDQPAANGTPFPKPEALKAQIDDLEAWVKRIRARRQK